MRALYLAAALLATAATFVLAPAAAHASPLDDYVSRNGKNVCAALDRAQTGGDIFRLSLTVAHDGGFSLKDAANVIGRAAASDCPWDESKLSSSVNAAIAPAQ